MTCAGTSVAAGRPPATGSARAAARARPHLPGGRLPAGRRPAGPGPGGGQRRRAAAGRPPGHPGQPWRPGQECPPHSVPQRPGRRRGCRGHPDAGAGGGGGRADGAPAQPGRGPAECRRQDRQRQRWAAADVSQPIFAIVPAEGSEECIRGAAEAVGFPCVVKAVSLSASQGVLRADDQGAALTAARRIRQVLAAARRPVRSRCWSRNTCPARS